MESVKILLEMKYCCVAGMEAAAFCVNKVKSVVVVGRGSVPFEPVLGTAVGGRIKQLYEEKGVQFALGSDVDKFVGDGAKVTAVQLQNGNSLPADVVIVGIGARPATAFLSDSGVNMERGAVVVDEVTNLHISYRRKNIHILSIYKSIFALIDV